jgi:hypothetical protein
MKTLIVLSDTHGSRKGLDSSIMKIVDNGRMKILYPTSEHFKLIKVGDESGALFDVVYLSKHAKVEDYTEILIEEAEGFGKELRSL